MNMIRILNIVVLCLTYSVRFSVTVVAPTSSHGGVENDSDLRSILMTVREQNRRLVLQNQRLQQIWLGMQQMCNTLDMETCECEGTNENMREKEEIMTTTEQMQKEIKKNTDQIFEEIKKNTEQIQIVFVESFGIDKEDGDLTLRVQFAAPHPHTYEWIYTTVFGYTTRTFGRNMTEINEHEDYGYWVGITVEKPETLLYIALRVHTEYEYLEIGFNQTVMEAPEHHYINGRTPEYFRNIDTVFHVPQDTELNITISINETKTVLDYVIDNLSIFVQGINSTTDPPTALEGSAIIRAEEKQPANSTTFTISVPYPEVQYGGRLMIYYQYKPMSTGLIARYMYGVFANILPYGSKTVFPENTFAVRPIKKQILIGEQHQSLFCYAIGNPRPHVSIIKVSKSGKEDVIESESVFVDSVTQISSYTFKHDPKKNNVEGRYLCRTTGSNRTIDQETELVRLLPAVFDESKTGILKNATTAVVISCKASGKPRPELQLHLYDEDGPDLLLGNGLYKVKMKNNKKSSRAILTLVPNEDLQLASFRTIRCTATQGEGSFAVRMFRTIEMFPGSNNTYLPWDWDLVHRINPDRIYLNSTIS